MKVCPSVGRKGSFGTSRLFGRAQGNKVLARFGAVLLFQLDHDRLDLDFSSDRDSEKAKLGSVACHAEIR
jgi:hypothetical protein